MKNLNMAIVGHGFVGRAVDYGFPSSNCTKKIIDPIYGTKVEDLDYDTDIAFVCVPTPMRDDASVDASILVDVVEKLVSQIRGLIVVKSTVVPSVISSLVSLSPRIIYNPEFLREVSASEDFVNPVMHIFGGEQEHTKMLEEIYRVYSLCKPCQAFHMTEKEASFVKYGMNSFLASKVLWFNKFNEIVEECGANYNTIIKAMGVDERIGSSHMNVPGADGRRGFSGSCFPKDTAAFAMFARTLGTDFKLLEHVIRENQEIRNNQDSETLEREKAQNVRFDYDFF